MDGWTAWGTKKFLGIIKLGKQERSDFFGVNYCEQVQTSALSWTMYGHYLTTTSSNSQLSSGRTTVLPSMSSLLSNPMLPSPSHVCTFSLVVVDCTASTITFRVGTLLFACGSQVAFCR